MVHHANEPSEFIERTFKNLDFIDLHKREDGPYEVLQVVLSFLTIIAFPREQFLNTKRMKWILLDDDIVVNKLCFPVMTSSSEYDAERPNTLDHLTRLLRNAVAHGNIELLDSPTLRSRRPDAELPSDLAEGEIAGIELWNEITGGQRTWGTILTEREMRETLRAMRRLAHHDAFRLRSAEPLNGGRPVPKGAELIKPGTGSRVADQELNRPSRRGQTPL